MRSSLLGSGLSPTVRRLGVTSFFQDIASEMVYPLLPAFLASLGAGAFVLGAMESAADGLLALVKGWAGRASDRTAARKPFVIAGYAASAVARPLLAVAQIPAHVVGLRLWDRLAKGVRTAPRDAMVADAAPDGGRAYAMSFHRGLDNLGAALGPLAAAAILALRPGETRLVFLLATIPAVAGAAVVAFAVREAAHERGRGAAPSRGEATRQGAREPSSPLPRPLLPALAAFFLFSLGNATDAFLLLRASSLGLSAIGLTLFWCGFSAVKWVASAPSGRLADRIGPRLAVGAGWLLYAASYGGFATTGSLTTFLAITVLYAVSYGLFEGSSGALTLDLAGSTTGTGTALGAFHAASGFGVFVASALFGAIWQKVSPAAAFATGAALAAAATALLALAPGPARASR